MDDAVKSAIRTVTLALIFGCVLAGALISLIGCATPTDPWHEAARKPIDTGGHVWWEKTKRGNK